MRFVEVTRKGVRLDLPDSLRLIAAPVRHAYDWPFQLRSEISGVTPVMADATVWASRRTEFVHGWKTEPTTRLIFLAMRRTDQIPTEIAEAWGRRHAMAEDVAWYRKRRSNIGAPNSLKDDQLEAAYQTVVRESFDRARDRTEAEQDPRLRLFNPIVGGRPLAMHDEAELAQLMVAIDWHLAGRPDAC